MLKLEQIPADTKPDEGKKTGESQAQQRPKAPFIPRAFSAEYH